MAATTGQTIYNDFYRLVGMNYTGYYSPVQLSLKLERAFIQAIHDIFVEGIQSTTPKDRLNSLINTNLSLSVINNNQFYVEPLAITNATYSTNWTITTFLPHNIMAGQAFVINGAAGFTSNNPNTTFASPFTAISVTANTITFSATAPGAGTYTANSGTMVGVGSQLYYNNNGIFTNDYWRFLTVKASFQIALNYYSDVRKWSPVTPAIVSITGNNAPVVVTMNYYTRLRNEDNVSITGVLGNTNANGTFYLKQLNDTQYALYSDKYFQTPIIGNGNYISGGVMNLIISKYCTPYLSDEKINTLNKPSVENPKYELANNLVKIYPSDIQVQSITMDYIRKPYPIYSSGYLIDCTDNVINLENYYPKDFLTLITNIAGDSFLSEMRDVNGLQLTENTEQK